MKNKTRNQIIKEKRDELIANVYSSGDFLLEEVGKMFNRGNATIFRIVTKVGPKKNNITK